MYDSLPEHGCDTVVAFSLCFFTANITYSSLYRVILNDRMCVSQTSSEQAKLTAHNTAYMMVESCDVTIQNPLIFRRIRFSTVANYRLLPNG